MSTVPLPSERPAVLDGRILCQQCWRRKDPACFIGRRGKPTRRCSECADKYSKWSKRTMAEKLAAVHAFSSEDAYSVRFVLSSQNRKLGPIPVSTTARGSCPDACSFKNAGCFAEFSFQRLHWSRVPEEGMGWEAFCARVAALPRGQLWRHNDAGDLPGSNDAVDPIALRALVDANRRAGARGFTFSHKPVIYRQRRSSACTEQERRLWAESNRRAIASAVRGGFAINLSADSVAIADELAALRIAPVAVVLPQEWPSRAQKTPEGRQIVVCPNETEGLTCSECQLCAVADRQSIIGFRAHGQSKALVSEIVRARRST